MGADEISHTAVIKNFFTDMPRYTSVGTISRHPR